jgi:hypothetical protein
MQIEHFLRCQIWCQTHEENDDPLLSTPPSYFKRVACIPFENIGYIQESVDFNNTDVVMHDGEVIVACLRYDVILAAWQEYMDTKRNEIISFYRSN